MASLEKLNFVIVISYCIAVYMYSNMKHSVLQAAVVCSVFCVLGLLYIA